MLDKLPYEVVEEIVLQDRLTASDIANLKRVCRSLRDICDSNVLWKKKLARRWPGLLRILKTADGQNTNWRELFKKRLVCGCEVQIEIQKMSSYYYKKTELSKEAFTILKLFLDDHAFGFDFVTDELHRIMYECPKFSSLTLKYYAQKAMHYVQHSHLQAEWEEYLLQPPQEQSLEKGMIMVCQWFQPLKTTDEAAITRQLDEIAESVRKQLAFRCPKHPLLNWNKMNVVPLTETLWSIEETHYLLILMRKVIFTQFGFHSVGEDACDSDSYLLDEVLIAKKGACLTLATLFVCVARRLGIVCELDMTPSHAFVRWKEHSTQIGNEQYTYIDMDRKGKFFSFESLRNIIGCPAQSFTGPIAPVKLIRRLAHNIITIGERSTGWDRVLRLVRSGAELLLTVHPFETDTVILLCRIYLELNINLPEVISMLQDVQQRDPTFSGVVASMCASCYLKMASSWIPVEPVNIVSKTRPLSGDVWFAVGLIMRHKKYHYKCVICSWDSVCMEAQEWIIRMGVHRLSRKENQPFYSVLVDDGSTRYAAQENLEVHPEPQLISHPQIGKFFSEFRLTHFVPNEELAREYPEDDVIRETVLQHYFPVDELHL